MLTLEEIVDTAIKYQPFILAMELEKGVPLSYMDEESREALKFPDGHTEVITQQPVNCAE